MYYIWTIVMHGCPRHHSETEEEEMVTMVNSTLFRFDGVAVYAAQGSSLVDCVPLPGQHRAVHR